MDINLSVDPSDSVRIFINGNLAAEICVNALEGIADFEKELAYARRLEKLPKIFQSHVRHLIEGQDLWGEGLDKKEAKFEYVKGLLDGFQGKTISHPMQMGLPLGQRHLLPDVLPDSTPAYGAGYSHGKSIATILEAIDHAV